MFRKPTVFVLGAGASWHYGYPTGEELVNRVIEKSTELAKFFKLSAEQGNGNFPDFVTRNVPITTRNLGLWKIAEQEAWSLATRLKQVNPTLIDYFLAHNSDLHDIGRLVIAMVIFECEFEYHRSGGGNRNHLDLHNRKVSQGLSPPAPHLSVNAFDDDWLRFVIYKLTVGCKTSDEILKNKVHFVTFNYASSLERRLYSGLTHISHFLEADISEFMWKDRVFHMYGRVREKIDDSSAPLVMKIAGENSSISHTDGERILNFAFAASQGIHTIDGEDKVKDAESIINAVTVIERAETVYILGFGFDSQNVKRAGLEKLSANGPHSRNVLFTNFGGQIRVGMAAGRALLNIPNAFIPPAGKAIQELNNGGGPFRYQMSVKNVYDALSQDFESLETS